VNSWDSLQGIYQDQTAIIELRIAYHFQYQARIYCSIWQNPGHGYKIPHVMLTNQGSKSTAIAQLYHFLILKFFWRFKKKKKKLVVILLYKLIAVIDSSDTESNYFVCLCGVFMTTQVLVAWDFYENTSHWKHKIRICLVFLQGKWENYLQNKS
jgi:hypothetical protein